MSILDNLYPGSFRGVPFLIEGSDVSGGRKQVVHEFPNSDNRYVEDLGLDNETISINATVPSAEYFRIRDSLKAALERKGYGTLVHPFYGIRQVAVMSYSIAEDTTTLGYVKLSLVFKQAQELFSTGVINLENLSLLAASLINANRDGFYDSYAGTSQYSIASTAAFSAGRDIVNQIREAASNFTTRSGTNEEDLAVYRSRINDLDNNLGDYLATSETSTESFYDKVRLTVVALDALASDGRQGVDIANRFSEISLSLPVSTGTTAAQKARTANQNTLLEMAKVFAFSLYCRNISFYRANSVDEVNALREGLTALYEDLLASTTLSSEVRSSIQTLRAASNRYLETQALVAPQIQTLEVFGTPLTVIEYQLYGSLEDEALITDGSLSRTDRLRLLNRLTNQDPTYLVEDFKVYVGEEE
jgi:hypothetical protein